VQAQREAEPLFPSDPPFGRDPHVAAALVRALLDPSLKPSSRTAPAAAHPALLSALRAYLDMAPEGEWGRVFEKAVGHAMAGVGAAAAHARMCQLLGAAGRCGALAQALAMQALAQLHGLEARLPGVFCMPARSCWLLAPVRLCSDCLQHGGTTAIL
jgi:hypothetical protein